MSILQDLNTIGEKKILAIEDLRLVKKYINLTDLDIINYLDKNELLDVFGNSSLINM